MEGHGTAQTSAKDKYVVRVDEIMRSNESQSSLGIQLQPPLRWICIVGVPVSSVFHHEHIGLQVVKHLNGIRQPESNVSGISVKEDDCRELLLLGMRVQEQPRVDADTIVAFDEVSFVRDPMLAWTSIPPWVVAGTAWNATDRREVQEGFLWMGQGKMDKIAKLM